MIKLYSVPKCEASEQARKWLKTQGIAYQDYNLLMQGEGLRSLLYRLLPLLDGNVCELLATDSRDYRYVEAKLGNISLSEWVDYLVASPHLIKHPIICDEFKVQLGFHPDEIRRFIPHSVRKISCRLARERLDHPS